ncbi:UDP-3-O-acyl-N-acetylglucosamine deacetylase [Alphaproteobacteria bacterium]|mgnify:CR=1 FL=1|nr:UDP-3-O-acyl-N-acetylglucosamine deacetylase [Alphaproteobacteria bacterium]
MAPPPASLAQIHERFATASHANFASMIKMGVWQTTLKASVECAGIGLHSGSDIHMTLRPAPADSGIIFIRTDVENPVEAIIPAVCGSVCDVTLSSKIGNKYGHVVGTVEHLLAALAGLRVDNAIIEINGPEVPIMDGSAKSFIQLIDKAGICELPVSRRVIRIKQPIRVDNGDGFCELVPDTECVFEAEIDFESNAIGRQSYEITLDDGRFDTDVANARTFCMLAQVEAMNSAGLALGGSMDNAIVIDGDTVLNAEGLRSPSEFVQHKLLDAVGDLYLLGLHVVGRYRGYKSGHSLHNKLLNALFMQSDAFEIISLADGEQILAAE